MAMELRNRLEAALGRPLSATLAWNYPTVDALVAHPGRRRHAARPSRRPLRAAGAGASSPLDAVANLSR